MDILGMLRVTTKTLHQESWSTELRPFCVIHRICHFVKTRDNFHLIIGRKEAGNASCHCSRSVWIMPSIIHFRFCLALKRPDSRTRWFLNVPSNSTILHKNWRSLLILQHLHKVNCCPCPSSNVWTCSAETQAGVCTFSRVTSRLK